MLETYHLVLRRLTLADAHDWLVETTAAARLVNPSPEDYRLAGERVRRYRDQAITLFVAVLSEHLDLQVWTYDHHFDVMGVNVWR